MRWNENEVAALAHQTPAWEGKLHYKPPKSKNGRNLTGLFQSGTDEPRDRWFRLRANCLFYFRLTTAGGRPPLGTEPLGVLILENYHVQQEFEAPSAFSIIFSEESGSDKKHVFVASCERHAKQWQNALKGASYQELRDRLVNLQIELRQKTNCDPLKGTAFESNPLFSPPGSSSQLPDFFNASNLDPPRPKPRKNRPPKSTFQSHVMENWENHSPHQQVALSSKEEEKNVSSHKSDLKQPSFQSHVPTGNLIDF